MDYDIDDKATTPLIHNGGINYQDPSYTQKTDQFSNNLNKVQPTEEMKDSLLSQDRKKGTERIKQLVEQVKTRIQKVKEEKKAKDEMVPYGKILWTYADGTDKFMIFIGYIMAIATGLGLPSFSYFFGDITNDFTFATSDGLLDAMSQMALKLTIIGAVVWVTSYIYFVFLVIVAERLTKKTRVAYLRSILQQEIGWFDQTTVTELPSRISKETQSIQKALGEKVGQLMLTVATSLAGFFFAFYRGWMMSLILLAVFPVILFMMGGLMKAMQSGVADNLKAYGQSAGYAEQALNAIRVVQAFGQEKTEVSNYEKHLERAKTQGVKTHMKSAIAIGGFMFVIFGYYAYGFYTGSWLITKQVENSNSGLLYNIGDILSCFFGIVFGVMSMGMSTAQMKAIAEGKVAGKMAFDIIDRKPQILLDDPQALIPSEIKGRIEFRNVTFTYPSRKDQKVLDDFSAVFEQGKTTAIVGASGSGKSTIVQLIERFYDPDTGAVLVDNMNLKQINLRDFRRKVGLVSQEPVLFNCTIKENMLYVKPRATDDEIVQALKLSNAWEFVSGLDKGINTNVGNAGGQLSGGQKQRIAISRAFIKKPKILLLDEATSALDKRNEKEVQAAIDSIRTQLGSITTIVIAHRLSTIRNADNIIVMNKGRIVENGNHEALLENYPGGIYAKFVREQLQAEQQNVQDGELVHQEEEAHHQTPYVDELVHKRSTIKKKRNDEQEKQETEMKEKADKDDKVKEEENERIKKGHDQKNNMKRMMAMTEPKSYISLGLFLSLIAGSVMPVFAIILVEVLFNLSGIDYERIREQADFYCLMFALCGVASAFSVFGHKFIFGVLGESVTLKIRRQLYSRILQKHIGYFDEKDNAPGNLSNTMASDAQTINGVSAEGLASQIEASWALITGVVLGFLFCWPEALVCLACVPFMMAAAVISVKFQQGMSQSSDQASKEANILCGDAILNYKTVASFGYEDQIVYDYERLLEGPVRVAVRQCHSIAFIFGFTNFVKFTIFAVLFYFAALFSSKGWITGVSVFDVNDLQSTWMAIFCMMFGASASGQAQSFGPDLGKAKQAAAKIFGIIDLPSEINAVEQPPNVRGIDNKTFRGEIEFRDVWFRYPTRKSDWVLRGLNLRIHLNETVALVGESGCGKSTIVSLILRFYDVNFGKILIDGVDIKDYDLHEYRKMIGLVQQEPILFNYTISENILYGSSQAANSEIKQAAEVANATEFIESQQILQIFDDKAEALLREFKNNESEVKNIIGDKEFTELLGLLEDLKKEEAAKGVFAAEEGDIDRRDNEQKDVVLSHGYHISCGIKGCKISGGQKQRIAIARAIIRRPKILILDEATSALDEESQRKVQVALDRIMVDRTSIVIAHRLSTVEKCDRILVLEEGRLVEEGRFYDLKQKEGGVFANLASGMQQAKGQ